MSPVVSTALSPGDVVGEERPLVHVMLAETQHVVCNHCLKVSVKELKKCSKCRLKWYCSPECQSVDWVYHRRECRVYCANYMDTNRWSVKDLLLLRLYLYLQSIGSEAADQQIKTFDGQTVALKDVEAIQNTIYKTEYKSDDEVMKWFACFAIIGVKSLDKDLLRQSMVIIDHFRAAGLQAYSTRWPLNRKVVGLALLSRFGQFRHSCRPNITLAQNGLSTQLRALKPIAAGDELTVGFVTLSQNYSQRRQEMKDRFFLYCECDRCQHPNQDNGINFDRLKQMRDLYISEAQYLSPERVLELYPKVAKDLDTVYGDYHSTKTDIYHSYLCALIRTQCPDKQLLSQVTKQFKHYIDVTHGPNHPLKTLYKLNRKLLRIGVLMLPD